MEIAKKKKEEEAIFSKIIRKNTGGGKPEGKEPEIPLGFPETKRDEYYEKEEVKLIEELADLEHRQWWGWSQDIAGQNNLRIETIERWKKLWIPYLNLPEEMKEENRKWARKVLKIINLHKR